MTKPISTIDIIVARAASKGLTTEEYLQLLISTEDSYASLRRMSDVAVKRLMEEIKELKGNSKGVKPC